MTISTTIAYAFGTQTVSSTALALSAFTDFAAVDLSRASRATIVCLTNGVRYRYDSAGLPTAAVGIPIAAGATVVIVGQGNIAQLTLIRSTGSDASVIVTLEA